MGSFDSTCAVTRVAIHHMDPVYVVVWGPYYSEFQKKSIEPTRSTYELLGATYPKNRESMYNKVRSGDIQLYRGFYNDYGWIEEVPRPDILDDGNWQSKVCFVHDEVMQYVCKRAKTSLEGDNYNPLDAIFALAEFAHLTRTPLFVPDWLLGEQYAGKREWTAQAELLELTGAILDRKYKEDWEGA